MDPGCVSEAWTCRLRPGGKVRVTIEGWWSGRRGRGRAGVLTRLWGLVRQVGERERV
jgi:hypothetical protein